MQTINLSKGSTINLSKTTGGKKKFYVGMSWGNGVDLDVSAFLCRHEADGSAVLIDPSPQFLISYATDFPTTNGVYHSGDNLTGADAVGQTDDESMRILIDEFDPRIVEVSLVATMHNARAKGMDFGKVQNASLRICDLHDDGTIGDEIAVYNLTENARGFISMQFGSLMKDASGDWSFHALGQGYDADLGQIIQQYSPSTNVTY